MLKALVAVFSLIAVVQAQGSAGGSPNRQTGISSCCVGRGCEHATGDCSPIKRGQPSCSISCPADYAAHCFCAKDNGHSTYKTAVCQCRHAVVG
ncbi:MAG: hypothetical protein MHM6MM_003966 [Cercozoa sp. M6MM]